MCLLGIGSPQHAKSRGFGVAWGRSLIGSGFVAVRVWVLRLEILSKASGLA